MLKDTKSLGNNKAPACESRGFVLKKEGVLFDTPSALFMIYNHVSLSKNSLKIEQVNGFLNIFPF